jgi:hypothetical protein
LSLQCHLAPQPLLQAYWHVAPWCCCGSSMKTSYWEKSYWGGLYWHTLFQPPPKSHGPWFLFTQSWTLIVGQALK